MASAFFMALKGGICEFLTVSRELLMKVEGIMRSVGDFQMRNFRQMKGGKGGMKAVRETVSFVDVESER